MGGESGMNNAEKSADKIKVKKSIFKRLLLSHACAVYFGGDCFGYAQLH